MSKETDPFIYGRILRGGSNNYMKEKKNKGLTGKRIVLLVALAVLVGSGVFLKVMKDSGRFYRNTLFNGMDISGMTPEQMVDLLEENIAGTRVSLMENGEEVLSGSLSDFGYEIDRAQAENTAAMIMNIQRSDLTKMIGSLIHGDTFLMELPCRCDEERLAQTVVSSALKGERYPSEDACLKYKKKKKQYTIKPEVYGNEIADADLAALVKDGLDRYISGKKTLDTVTVDIPESVYIHPEITAQSSSLINQRNVYNMYCKAKIIYTFGSETTELSWKTTKNWLKVEDGYGVFDEEAARDFIYGLESTYNTRYHDRYFQTTMGGEVMIPGSGNEYGYTIDEDGELARMLVDLASNEEITREPVYVETNDYGNPLYYRREGRDDLVGTYVEVNLSLQHLWFYVDGALIVESDFVSGNVASNLETQTGVFPLAYKESPSILTGGNAQDGYRTEVKYWMPFYEGQGLHDATWRSAFGGQIYQTGGSHGCVNLPLDVAGAIYNNIEAGMAIVIYK